MLRITAFALMLLSFGLSVWAVAVLPPVVPVHFNLKGEPDAYGSKFLLLIFPVITVGIYALMSYLPRFDPYSEKVKERIKTVRVVRDITVIFFSFLNSFAVLAAFRGKVEMWYIGIFLGLLMVLLGNYLPKLPHNWFVGVRTPWTLASERVWRKTHRLFGVLFVVYGLLIGGASFLSPEVLTAVLVVGSISLVVIAILYSYVLFRRERKEHLSENRP